jgi:hypothetical protein
MLVKSLTMTPAPADRQSKREGSVFVLLDKRHLFPLLIVALSIFGGIKLHAQLLIRESVKRHRERNAKVKIMNTRLIAEKDELKQLMKHIEQNKKSDSNQLSEATEFKDAATAVFNSLQERGDLLASKEELLWAKELEIVETRRRMSARQEIETEMAQFINSMASTLIEHNCSIPSGLARKPYVAASVSRKILGVSGIMKPHKDKDNQMTHIPKFGFLQSEQSNHVPTAIAVMTRTEEELAERGLLKILENASAVREGFELMSNPHRVPGEVNEDRH